MRSFACLTRWLGNEKLAVITTYLLSDVRTTDDTCEADPGTEICTTSFPLEKFELMAILTQKNESRFEYTELYTCFAVNGSL